MGWEDARQPVRRVSYRASEDPAVDETGWPYTLAPVRQLLRDGLDLAPGVTFLVGENGSGKSTLVEAVAMAYGMGAEGGSTGARTGSRPSESPLHRSLRLERGIGASRWGFFLRAETMHGFYSYLEDNPGKAREPEPVFHAMSHGESFLEVLRTRFASPALYCLDEPESALSFTACLALVGVLADVVAAGGQVLCATHSPLLAAMPGATVLELTEDGYAPVAWDGLALVDHWRRYLRDPHAYLRHLLP